MPKSRKKVLVAINTLTSIHAAAYTDHMLFYYSLGRRHRNVDFYQFVARRMSIDRFRNHAAKLALQTGMDYVMFIDDDMQFSDPKEVFGPLQKANVDICAAFNYIRGYPYKIMAFKSFKEDGHSGLKNLTDEDLLPENPKLRKDGVLMCDAIGTAVCLIKTKVFKRTPAPWFLTGQHNTEDIYFCCKSRDYYKRTTIAMHTLVKTGHLLDPEVISADTRPALKKYIESFMTSAQIEALEDGLGDRGKGYVEESIEPGMRP